VRRYMMGKFRLIFLVHVAGVPFIAKGWHCIKAPVDKDAEFAILIPLGDGYSVDGSNPNRQQMGLCRSHPQLHQALVGSCSARSGTEMTRIKIEAITLAMTPPTKKGRYPILATI